VLRLAVSCMRARTSFCFFVILRLDRRIGPGTPSAVQDDTDPRVEPEDVDGFRL